MFDRAILAFQFLTRLPVPALKRFDARELSRAAAWFPFVGIVVGIFVAGAAVLGAHVDGLLGALLGLVMWVWITGGLHLDGLADLADALGASHREPQRFLAVLKDPHIGVFGVLALIIASFAKLILFAVTLREAPNIAMTTMAVRLALICAWARWGALICANTLPVLSSGEAERFAWHRSTGAAIFWCCVLLLLSVVLAPALIVAPAIVLAWRSFLRTRIGGMTGDCLGAGIELTEIALLVAIVLAQAWGFDEERLIRGSLAL
jgi:adenosylcobinamide-GDP ribazoletransferase